MKVLVWATTFGADLWSFTRYLDEQPGVEVCVVMKDPETYAREPISRLYPLRARVVARTAKTSVLGVPGFRPDVTVLDNEVPPPGKSRAGFVLWHGFGWKGPNDRKELRGLHLALRAAWGDPLRPNPRFRWQCFGPWDFEHRTTVSAFAPENCRVLGAASHDDLRVPIERESLREFYPFDVGARPTVLIAPTWHYGEVFAHWGGDRVVFARILAHLEARGANVILRLHDSFRFDPEYVGFLRGLAEKHPGLLLKFKDQNPDNILDMQVADVLVTNFSSIANLFYATGRPTVHVYPVRSADEEFVWRKRTLMGMREQRLASVKYIWKLPPEDNGGLLARDADDLIAGLDRALDDPSCCFEQTRDFLDRHMLGADGKNRARAFEALEELVGTSSQ